MAGQVLRDHRPRFVFDRDLVLGVHGVGLEDRWWLGKLLPSQVNLMEQLHTSSYGSLTCLDAGLNSGSSEYLSYSALSDTNREHIQAGDTHYIYLFK